MVGFLCSLWPWLLGGLLGWLLCGLLARRLLRGPDIRGQLTEKDAHIRRLTGEMATLQARPPVQVEKMVEKIVEKPVDRVIEKFVDRPVDRVVEKVVERPVDRVVEKIVEKYVDRPVDRIVEKIVDRPVDRIVEKTVEKLVPDTKGLEERDSQLADWRRRYGELEVQLRQAAEGPALDLAAAKAAGFSVKGADDLELIEGIGPKIAELLRNAGIRSFAQLADTPTAKIQSILDAGGSQYRMANPGTWSEQAGLAARNQWVALKALQDQLNAGNRA